MPNFEIKPDVRSASYLGGECPSCGRVRLLLYVDGSDEGDSTPRAVGVRCEKCFCEWLLDPQKADIQGDYSDTDPLHPRPPENNPFGGDEPTRRTNHGD